MDFDPNPLNMSDKLQHALFEVSDRLIEVQRDAWTQVRDSAQERVDNIGTERLAQGMHIPTCMEIAEQAHTLQQLVDTVSGRMCLPEPPNYLDAMTRINHGVKNFDFGVAGGNAYVDVIGAEPELIDEMRLIERRLREEQLKQSRGDESPRRRWWGGGR